MHCRLGKQALMDVVLDYLESKYGLLPVFGLSIVERVWRIQEQIKYMSSIIALNTNLSNKIDKKIQWEDGWGDWDD
jgi:hypothetical protein